MQSSVEVTHEDFFSHQHHRSQQQQQQQNRKTLSHNLKKHNGHSTATTTTSRPPKRALAGFKKLWSSQRKRNNTPSLMEQQQQQQRLLHQEPHDTADESVSSDQARNGESTRPDRLSSLHTVASVDDTVKASNHAHHATPTPPLVVEKPGPVTRKRSGWGKLKNRLFKRTDAIPEEDHFHHDDDYDDRAEMVLLQRARSSPERTSTGKQQQQQQQHDLDDAIKGRLDGMDVLSLGPCRLGLKRKFSRKEEGLVRFVETMCPRLTTHSLVRDMVRTSAGRDPPELVLEGFFPGGDDRWIVRIMEEQAKQQQPQQQRQERQEGQKGRRRSESPLPPPSLTPTDDGDDDDDDEDCSVVCGGEDDLQLLLESMWGKHETPPPSHVAKSHSSDSADSQDDVLQLAAACSVPIDIDEDTFIVDTANHLQSIHDIASVPLRVSVSIYMCVCCRVSYSLHYCRREISSRPWLSLKRFSRVWSCGTRASLII